MLSFKGTECPVQYVIVIQKDEYVARAEGYFLDLSTENMFLLVDVVTATLTLQDGRTTEIVPHGNKGFMGPVIFTVNTPIN